MKTKLIVKLNDMSNVYLLEKYGRITFVDEFIDVVYLYAPIEQKQEITRLSFVDKVDENRKGTLLGV